MVLGADVEGETGVGVGEDVAKIEDEFLVVGVVGGECGGLNLIVEVGGEGVGVGVEENLGIVGLEVGDTVKEFDPGANGKIDGGDVAGVTDTSLEVGGEVEDVSVEHVDFGDDSVVFVDVTMQDGIDGLDRERDINVVHQAGVKGDEVVSGLESETKEVDVGSEMEVVGLIDASEDGVEIDEGAVGAVVVVDDIVELQRTAKLHVDPRKDEVHAERGKLQEEGVVGGE